MASPSSSANAHVSAHASYVCDTLPAPRLASSDAPNYTHEPAISDPDLPLIIQPSPSSPPNALAHRYSPSPPPSLQQPPPRKLCVRHQRMADEGTNLKLQQSLDALPMQDREAVNAIWSNFSSSSHPRRALILQGLLTMCCFSQLSLLTEQLAHLIRIDPFAVLPREVSLKILGYLDATSLCRAAQVSRKWKHLADDDILWRGICEQHIGQKCAKCGWSLPILDKKRKYGRLQSQSPCPLSSSADSSHSPSLKRPAEDASQSLLPFLPLKRQRSEFVLSTSSMQPSPASASSPPSYGSEYDSPSHALLASRPPSSSLSSPPSSSAPSSTPLAVTRPWKDVYSERMAIERNWRRGRCTVRTFKGHTDGVMCAELHCLKGHTRAVRALQFDDVKLITGSMDNTIKVWDWRRGRCVRTLRGHQDGVVCLNFDENVLASGSVDSTIKVWNLRTGGAFTLRCHSEWVNSVLLWDSNSTTKRSQSTLPLLYGSGSSSPNPNATSLEIDPGKMLFSASDDGTIRLWDLTLRTCVRQFTGHMGQVQSMKLLLSGDCDVDIPPVIQNDSENESQSSTTATPPLPQFTQSLKKANPILISGSLDNTIKLWDIETGKPVRTFFGHIEGVWSVASDKMRLVSGSHDRTIKVWSKEEGRCTATLVGHEAAVSCVALGEDKIVSGSDDGTVKVWSFAG
ncbi:WD40-repeat-containing domain protein [Cyathus striatus]|nr:WD40-repeat-containing domain protein [Cyathus striatus]